MRVCRVLGFLLAIFVAASGVAQAAPVTLASLIPGGTLTIGDKTFSDFGFTCLTAPGSCGAEGITPGNITVEAFFENNTGILRFGGDMISTTSVDFILQYAVTASAGLISSIGQSFNLTAQGGLVAIGEDVRSGSFFGPIVANSSISFADLQDPTAEIGDDLIIDPGLTKVYVTKDVNISYAPGATGLTGTSLLTQTFHQTPVPEPTSLLLLGTGLAGLAAWRKRSK